MEAPELRLVKDLEADKSKLNRMYTVLLFDSTLSRVQNPTNTAISPPTGIDRPRSGTSGAGRRDAFAGHQAERSEKRRCIAAAPLGG